MQRIHFVEPVRHAVRCFVLAGAALVFFEQIGPASAGPTFMSETELLETIPGNGISAKTVRGVPWTQKYSATKTQKKGDIDGVFDGKPYKAKWFVKEGHWCEDWGDGKACWMVERKDTKTLRLYENGKPKKNLWHLN